MTADVRTDPGEAERLAALERSGLFDSPPEERFDRVVRLAQHIFDVPYAGLNLIGEDRHFTKAAAGDRYGAASSSIPRSDSLCALTVEKDRTLEIPDLHLDQAFAGHPLITQSDIRFYAGAPLRTPGGHRIGSLCIIDDEPRDGLSETQLALLRDLANWLERELASADLEQGAELQRRLLPRSIPDLSGWEVAGRCLQAGAVGGDFYDWQVLAQSGEIQVALADVMGKGVQAALLAASVRAVFRGASPHGSLAGGVERVAADLAADLSELDSFVTFFAARVDPHTGRTEFVDAGHGLAFLVGAGRAVALEGDGLPLGVLPGTGYEPTEEHIGPGEALVVVSDGFLDVHGDRTNLLEVVRAAAATSPGADELATTLAASASGSLASDDVTAVVLRRDA